MLAKKRCRLFNANPRLSNRTTKTEKAAPAVNMRMLIKNMEDKVCLKRNIYRSTTESSMILGFYCKELSNIACRQN